MSQVVRLWSQISFLFSIYFILLYYFCIDRLTAEQCRILETAKRGHNILITGQGGSGKSYLINRNVKSLRTKGKNVTVVERARVFVWWFFPADCKQSVTFHA